MECVVKCGDPPATRVIPEDNPAIVVEERDPSATLNTPNGDPAVRYAEGVGVVVEEGVPSLAEIAETDLRGLAERRRVPTGRKPAGRRVGTILLLSMLLIAANLCAGYCQSSGFL